jgi:hypothetical protein
MPAQIKRLALLFGGFIVLFLVARHFLVPESFGEYGHYRGLALVEEQEHVPKYAGQQACAECHQDMMDVKMGNEHKTLSCETCHGPGLEHVNSTDSIMPVRLPKGRDFCLLCHRKDAARTVDNIVQVDPDKHNKGKDCIECHNPHSPWELKE